MNKAAIVQTAIFKMCSKTSSLKCICSHAFAFPVTFRTLYYFGFLFVSFIK